MTPAHSNEAFLLPASDKSPVRMRTERSKIRFLLAWCACCVRPADRGVWTRLRRCQPGGFAGMGPERFLTPVREDCYCQNSTDDDAGLLCVLGKEEPSFSPTSTRANSPTHPTPGGHSSSATHPNKGWKEPRQRVRESSHGHSGGEERQLEPPQLQFSVGISPGSQVEGYLHPHRAHSVCSGRGCHRWSQLVACGTHRQRGGSCHSLGQEGGCSALLFSSFSSQDQRDVKHFGRAATLKTASVE